MSEPASPPKSLRRQLLNEAVEENLAAIRGEIRLPQPPPDAPRPRRRNWPIAMSILALAAAGAATWWQPWQTTPAGPPPDAGPPNAVTAAAVTASEAVDRPPPEPSFATPRPIGSEVLPLEVRRIVLDPGHGGDDLGTTAHGLSEKDLTLDISRRLRNLLMGEGFDVYLTRHDDRVLSLKERATLANELRADVFVSIHINWLVTRHVRGVETYFLGTTDDPVLNEIARRENRGSGYSLADMRQLLEGIYADVRQAESQRFATRVQGSLHRSLRRHNPALRDRGVKSAPFVVLVATDMPAILAEVSCLSNQEEAELLSRPLYRDHIAEALFRGIRGYADDVNQSEERES